MELIKEFWEFALARKKFLLIPIIFFILLMGVIIFASETAVAPFIYVLF